jgi:hypothetical protein
LDEVKKALFGKAESEVRHFARTPAMAAMPFRIVGSAMTSSSGRTSRLRQFGYSVTLPGRLA